MNFIKKTKDTVEAGIVLSAVVYGIIGLYQSASLVYNFVIEKCEESEDEE